MASTSSIALTSICRERVTKLQLHEQYAACVFANQSKLLLSGFLARYVAVGDEITFPIPMGDTVGAEILIAKNSTSTAGRYLYEAPVAYVSQPKQDKRNEHFVAAEVQRGSRGISMIFLPCDVLREYFYRLPR
jgi:hypothetical protein